MGHREGPIQYGVLTVLAMYLELETWHNPNIPAMRARKRSRFFKVTPDILGYCTRNAPEKWRGKSFACEVKSLTGKESGDQIKFGEKLSKSGGIYILVRSPQDAIRQLKELGVIR